MISEDELKSNIATTLQRAFRARREIRNRDLQAAALILQSVYRGRKTRKLIKESKPHTNTPSSYPPFFESNERALEGIPGELMPISGNFVVVGTFLLRSLEIALELTPAEFRGAVVDGYTNVPKLFILDFSSRVYNIWISLKKLFKETSLYNFKEKVRDDRYSLEIGESHLISGIERLCPTPEIYQYMRNVVAKSTIMLGDWYDERNFTYIKEHSGTQPVYLYASNIVEVTNDYLGEEEAKVRKILENICMLEPVISIQTRTSLSTFIERNLNKIEEGRLGKIFKPEHTVLSTTHDPRELYRDLNSPVMKHNPATEAGVGDESERIEETLLRLDMTYPKVVLEAEEKAKKLRADRCRCPRCMLAGGGFGSFMSSYLGAGRPIEFRLEVPTRRDIGGRVDYTGSDPFIMLLTMSQSFLRVRERVGEGDDECKVEPEEDRKIDEGKTKPAL